MHYLLPEARGLQGMGAFLERRPAGVASRPTSNAAKLRRWARAYARVVPPEVHVVGTEYHGTFAFEGWQLGHGAEGRGSAECGAQWRRREATIYLTSAGDVLCKHLWLGLGRRDVISSCVQYESDLELLSPMGLDGREEADECVRKAARKAAMKCAVFGVFGVTWVGL